MLATKSIAISECCSSVSRNTSTSVRRVVTGERPNVECCRSRLHVGALSDNRLHRVGCRRDVNSVEHAILKPRGINRNQVVDLIQGRGCPDVHVSRVPLHHKRRGIHGEIIAGGRPQVGVEHPTGINRQRP